jgi:hypothetical protein
MVNDLARQKISTDLLFHHQTMLADIARAIGVRMIGTMDQNIATIINNAPPIPSRAKFGPSLSPL